MMIELFFLNPIKDLMRLYVHYVDIFVNLFARLISWFWGWLCAWHVTRSLLRLCLRRETCNIPKKKSSIYNVSLYVFFLCCSIFSWISTTTNRTWALTLKPACFQSILSVSFSIHLGEESVSDVFVMIIRDSINW